MKDKVFLDTNIFVYAVDSSQQWSRQQTMAKFYSGRTAVFCANTRIE